MAINIKNQFYRLIKLIIRYIKIWRFIFVVVFIVFLMLLGLLTANYLQGGKMAVISSPVGKIFLSPYRLLRKSSNFLYLGYELKNHDLPTYKLIIDPKDLKFLNNNLPEPFVGNRLTDEYRRRVPAIFYYQDHEYKVEVSYRGWVSNHWGNAKKSWDIKFDKDNPFKGLSGLNLIIPEDRGIGLEYYNNYRAKKLGLYPLFSSFIVLEINGRNNGMYFAVEPWDENYLAKHELIDDVDMFAFDEDRHRYDRDMDIFEDVQYFSKKESNSLYQNKDYSLVIKLVDLINNSDDEEFKKEIVKILDIDNFLTWQAHYILSSSVHNDLSNIRFFIDRSTGKIIFVPWDVNMREPDQNLEKSMFSLYSRITMIPEFAHKRNKIL